jgi:valyl-tRNA synthetase
VGRCQRCDTVLEPLVSLQWFVKIQPLAEKAVAASDAGEVRFSPESWKKTYDEWMRNIRDWCVSRQLWWGHEIPAWYCPDGHVTVPRPGEPDPKSCAALALTRTATSSTLGPRPGDAASVLGWPERTKDLARFYPTDVLTASTSSSSGWPG